jgi:hypothetical protein
VLSPTLSNLHGNAGQNLSDKAKFWQRGKRVFLSQGPDFTEKQCRATGSERRISVPFRSQIIPAIGRAGFINIGGKMPLPLTLRQFCAVLCTVAFSLTASAALAQSGGGDKSAEPQKPAADIAKEGQKKIDEIAEATRVLTGPAGNPECVWLGRRVVSLLWRDDLDTAFRHLDLYDRFGCPSAHVQATFRCLVRQGNIDPKAQETLNGRVHACWVNPGLAPTDPVAAKAPAPAASDGTTPR